jgi:hypothetical protein
MFISAALDFILTPALIVLGLSTKQALCNESLMIHRRW